MNCRSHSRYGRCGRTAKHNGPHAVPVGDGIVFGYESSRGLTALGLGYGHMHGDDIETTPTRACELCNPRPAATAPAADAARRRRTEHTPA